MFSFSFPGHSPSSRGKKNAGLSDRKILAGSKKVESHIRCFSVPGCLQPSVDEIGIHPYHFFIDGLLI
jgi:hypothetical protein